MEDLTTRALCSVSDVKGYVGVELADTSYDELLKRLINAATDEILLATGRDFILEESSTRTFGAAEHRLGKNEMAIHDAATVTGVAVKTEDGDTRASDMSYVDKLPRSRRSYEPITALRFRELSGLKDSDYVEVTGTFGWPSVPEPIRQACILTVASWFARDVKHFSETFQEDVGAPVLPRSIPSHALDTINSYKRPVTR